MIIKWFIKIFDIFTKTIRAPNLTQVIQIKRKNFQDFTRKVISNAVSGNWTKVTGTSWIKAYKRLEVFQYKAKGVEDRINKNED